MLQEIKIPFGKREDRYLHISEVSSGLDCHCRCPGCDVPLIARKGDIRKHHFAHSRPSKCLPPESLLHLTGKEIIAQILRDFIRDGKGIKLRWTCDRCGAEHKGAPFQNARRVAVELAVGEFVPGVSILDENDRVLAIFEVMVSQEPNINARKFYLRNGIGVFEFKLGSLDDLEKLREGGFLLPSRASFCPRPHCVTCRRPFRRLNAVVSTGICLNCREAFPVAYLAFGEKDDLQVFPDSNEGLQVKWTVVPLDSFMLRST